MITSIEQIGLLNQIISYTYNDNFQPNTITYAGTTENYTYDEDNTLITAGDYSIQTPIVNRETIQTDGTFSLESTYNAYGELETKESNLTKMTLTRNDNGQIVQKSEELGKKTRFSTYTYDERSRLTDVVTKRDAWVLIPYDGLVIPVPIEVEDTQSYTYDANGNRASATINGKTTTASYTLDDNLIVYGDNTYLYNDDGYLETKTTPDGRTTYAYGTLGELLDVTTPTQTITYKHNANNQRVAKLVDGNIVEKYLWANLTTLLATYDANDNLKQRFEYADQRMPLSMTDSNGTKYYLHYDQVGTLRAVTDTSHNIIKEVTYDTFGTLLTDSNEAFTVPFGFAGGLYDSDTKLTRFGYRDYDAYTGKWTAKDPIGFNGGDSNLYGYVLGDPVGGFDPMGLAKCKYSIGNHLLTCTSNDGSQALITNLLFSGNELCKNNPKDECTSEEGIGAVPPDDYNISPNTKTGHEDWWALQSTTWIPKVSGLLHEFGWKRAGFNFHTGTGSNGCLTFPETDKDAVDMFNKLSSMFSSDAPNNTISVRK